MFGPYTPLQQLDVLADFGTKSYIVGSTNSLLLQQRDRYSDILINLDDGSINITSTSLKQALQLSVPDRRWIDFITQEVNDTWDEANPGRPKTMGYVGSEEFIRLQFEEYLLSLISSVKYHKYLVKHGDSVAPLPHIEGDAAHDFGLEFVEAWSRTDNYRIWDRHTEGNLFDIVEPRHPCAGGLTVDDVQRRIAQQVQDLHLDERFAQGREVLGRNLAAGREKASTIFNKLYADMEALREAQRKRAEEARLQQPGGAGITGGLQQQQQGQGERGVNNNNGVDLGRAQQTVQSVGAKAGNYMNSWAVWAGEKRKAAGWGKSAPGAGSNMATGGGGWAAGWGRGGKNRNSVVGGRSGSERSSAASEKEVAMAPIGAVSPRFSSSTRGTDDSGHADGDGLLGGQGPDSPSSSVASPKRPERDRPQSIQSTKPPGD